MNSFLKRIDNLPIVRASKRIVVPGFDGIPLYNVGVFFVKGLMKGALNTRATSLSFQFFLSLFPALIFLFTLIPFIPIENFQEGLMEVIRDLLPQSAWELTENTLDDIINRQRGGLLSFLSIAVIYLATNGVDAMLEAFSESIHIERKRNYFHQKWVAFLILLLLITLLITGIGLIIFSSFAANYFIQLENFSIAYLVTASRWVVIVAMYYFAISFLYYFGNREREAWRFFSAGSTFTTINSILLSWAFSWYVNNLAM